MPYPTPRRTTTGYGTCDACDRRVLYALTTKHRKIIAIDPAPDPTGNQAVSVKDATYWTRQLSTDRPVPEEREILRRPHHATCPAARARTGVRPAPWRQR
ncbi:hypothetical protein [Streptomyces sp. G1]|uniref:hypothetical protein n=1 Tax=Streptomyces sp. G1 TaxID=361572 RepID=UPI002030C23E|nr:hypothetical protein [Streptomyces sp. G1]MCM1976816.1 hypothetical protein [Streptomyces sp. G1]